MNTENTNQFDFELVSPERILMSEKAWQVTIPGEMGDFGVRAKHASIVSSIRPGVVEIVSEQGSEPQKIFIAGGFADVTESNCTILAEEAMIVSDLDQSEIEKEISELTEKLSSSNDNIEKMRYQTALDVSKAKLVAVTN
ncbi:MAG: ATP synthase F1 subunit epsilon [Pseudomonadota bacterium]